jgi:hypothetical protein
MAQSIFFRRARRWSSDTIFKHNTICNTVQLYRTFAICLNFKLFAEALKLMTSAYCFLKCQSQLFCLVGSVLSLIHEQANWLCCCFMSKPICSAVALCASPFALLSLYEQAHLLCCCSMSKPICFAVVLCASPLLCCCSICSSFALLLLYVQPICSADALCASPFALLLLYV